MKPICFPMAATLTIKYLADCADLIPTLASWFEAEWPCWYGSAGNGDARHDLNTFVSRNELPIGVVAFVDGKAIGIAALKSESISLRPDLTPWAAAGLVHPDYRRLGIGGKLLCALEDVARDAGFPVIYCGTSTSATLLEREGWTFFEELAYHGEQVRLYRKHL